MSNKNNWPLFKSNFSTYEIMTTKDGHPTLWSKHFQELCHSTDGSYEETVHNYLLACQVENFLNTHEKIDLLEVGFGLGIGLLATLDLYFFNSYQIPFSYHALEIDKELINFSKQNVMSSNPNYQQLLDNLSTINSNLNHEILKSSLNNFDLYIHIGDARETIKNLHKFSTNFQVIYQDPFSPTKNPSLWTKEWFSQLARISDKNVKMSTYSASTAIRKSMLDGGYKLKAIKGFSTKRHMTVASLEGETDKELFAKLSRSPIQSLSDKKN